MHGDKAGKLERALYVVATPIGNMGDITLRALEALTHADLIAAEDTRNTQRLLQYHGIAGPRLLALHKHNERAAAEKILAQLEQGRAVALVTDAGTPAVSDPGALVVQAVREAGHRVVPIPGANAAIAALSASGLVHPHFLFYGFLDSKPAARRRELQALASEPHTLVFYEAPHRILESVADMQSAFGPGRQIVIARELTKLFETLHAGPLDDALDWLNADPNNQRGEFVLLVSGADMRMDRREAEGERVLALLIEELPLKQAVQLAAKISGDSRNRLYQHALQHHKKG
jgi:16S rRNA (cytidine1402-2'-O)-methyltransferase